MSAIASTPIDAEAKNAPTSGRLFFLDLSAGRILSANPDGSDLKTIINEGRKLPDGLAVLRQNSVRARNPQFCTISSIARFVMTMVHVQLRPAEFGPGGPLLSLASQTTSGESGASPATRRTEA